MVILVVMATVLCPSSSNLKRERSQSFRSMAKTYCCLLLILLIRQLLCSFAITSEVLFLSDHVPCQRTIRCGCIVSCHNHDFPQLTFTFESLSCPLSPDSKKLDHLTVNIKTLETFVNENETVELSVAFRDQSLSHALDKIINPMINVSEHKVNGNRDEEDLEDSSFSAQSRSTNSPDIQAEENAEKIAEGKDKALAENSAGCVEEKCRVHSISSNVLSNGAETESVALETPATAPPPPTNPNPHRTQTGSDLIPGAQVFHVHEDIQALNAFTEESVTGRESSCPLRLIILFIGLCIARIEF